MKAEKLRKWEVTVIFNHVVLGEVVVIATVPEEKAGSARGAIELVQKEMEIPSTDVQTCGAVLLDDEED